MINNEINKALHNYGYRYLSCKDGEHVYGKPLGYGILRADVSNNNTKLSVSLIVKGNMEHGKSPNLLWVKQCCNIISSPNNDLYLTCVQTIKDYEAEIFNKSPVAFLNNRFVRYDFEENNSFDTVLVF